MTRIIEGWPNPLSRAGTTNGPKFEVVVLVTTLETTPCALQTAANLSSGLGATIRVVAPWAVPFPLPLDEPPVKISLISEMLRGVAQAGGVPCSIEIALCRDPWQAIRQAIPRRSILVLAKAPSWWQFGRRRFEERLILEGHHIMYAAGVRSHA